MSKLVEGIKDRMVTAAREAAPAVVDAAQKAATAAADRKSTRLNSSHLARSRMPSSA